MNFEVRSDFASQFYYGEILDDDRVGAGFGDGGEASSRVGQFGIEDQRVVGYVALHPVAMQGAHRFGELGQGEADFRAGGEMGQSEIDGVGAGVNGGVELGPMADRTENFGTGHTSIIRHPSKLEEMSLDEYRSEFPITKNLTWLNHAAMAPLVKPAAEAMIRFSQDALDYSSLRYEQWLETYEGLRRATPG